MYFVELMHAISPLLMSDEDDVPAFMRDLIQRFCDVPESQWYTRRDPSSDVRYKDSSLYSYYSKGPSKKLARAMLSRPNSAKFVASIQYKSYADPDEDIALVDMRIALADALQPFTDLDVNETNVGSVLFDLIQESLEFVVNPELENERKLNMATSISDKAKGRFGSRLLEDCKHTCSRTGCGQHLQPQAADNSVAPVYGIVRIVGESREYDNLIALCPTCFGTYVVSHKKADEIELTKHKVAQRRSSEARQMLSTVDIERGITKVVEKLGRTKLKDLEPLNYDPVAVKDKIDEETEHFIYDEVMSHVTRYFRFVENQMREEAQLKSFDDDLLRAQIKALSRKLVEKGYSPARVHADLTDKLSQITKQDHRFCAVVVSYFVQSCEVLNASS